MKEIKIASVAIAKCTRNRSGIDVVGPPNKHLATDLISVVDTEFGIRWRDISML